MPPSDGSRNAEPGEDQYRAGSGSTIGWDIGGVHLKAALVRDGRVEGAAQAPCALWRGVDALSEALAALPAWARSPADHAVTMTGELCDAFPDRPTGVSALCTWARRHLDGPIRVYAGRRGFVGPDVATALPMDVASANWHATARLVGRGLTDALLVDIGSTTTDLIPVVAGAVQARGYTDAERLRTRELVYAGVVRTPLMALATGVPFRGERPALMNEVFATTADVYRHLGRLQEGADQQETADGRGKSLPETETRLARMIGCDRSDATSEEWHALAHAFQSAQLARLEEAARDVVARSGVPAQAPVVGCGVGHFLAADLAMLLGRPFQVLASILGDEGNNSISYSAPAVAVAILAAEESSASA